MNSQSLSARLPEAAREWGCTGLGIVSKVPRNKWCSLSLPSRLSEPFQSAHNKCARHRTRHLPPQIRALMGRQIAVRGGHAGRPVPAPPACLPAGGTSVCAPGCAQHVWTDIRVCQWMGTEQERVLVCMRACPRSGLQESADVQAPHTCVMGACALSAWGWPSRNCLRVRRERSVARECVGMHVTQGG